MENDKKMWHEHNKINKQIVDQMKLKKKHTRNMKGLGKESQSLFHICNW